MSSEVPTYVLIPFRGKFEMTQNLVNQFVEQDEYKKLWLFNNGEPEDIYPFNGRDIEIFEAKEVGLHKMWNVGVALAVLECGTQPVNVLIMNNDTWIGNKYISILSSFLRKDPILAGVSGTNDDVQTSFVQYSRCEQGFEGPGFMIKGELDNLPFDEGFSWWYGETDWVVRIELAGYRVGTVHGARLIHLDGGSVSVKEYATEVDYWNKINQDTERFHNKWAGMITPGEKRIPEHLMGSRAIHVDM